MDQRAHVAEDPLLRVLADGAGVDDDDVGALVGVDDVIAHLHQHTPDQFGVGFILLAAVSIHIGQRLFGQLVVEGADLGAVFLLTLNVLSGDNRCFSLHGDSSSKYIS